MAKVRNWTPDRLPSLAGKRYLITGGNSGIGLEAAKIMAAAGADIVIACRNPDKAEEAASEIAAAGAGAVDTVALDLSSQASVRAAADEIRSRWDALDGLVNNAGIMQTPDTRTEDGFELQLGTNHLGHFLLAGLLFDLVEKAAGRITVVSSIAHKFGEMHFDDLMLEQRYDATKAYGQSKLANMLFAQELARKLAAAGSSVMANACHPGYSATNLQSTGPEGFLVGLYGVLNKVWAQSAYKGAIPTVLAVAGEEAENGGYYGPVKLMDSIGPVGTARIAGRGRDEQSAAELWQRSEALTDMSWTL
ncbi:short-chain dehydrogenase [Halioglobus japonicus]|uniref:KR domain-containing protein n=1 Tax=Halioglobus japonicus TaxID=930805 RepID=A0AAP8MD10_9GAMM|nr:oxidoreductase [Halioglobus japonicus]AQA17628.1 short-chain dehydrogenase [Halioglobus japonicus]PLW85568.1 KR domain-containing protein [Halioglobus japonicus]GHD16315.1 putative short-chain dehydrogenase/reductase [Halioglobus japonicus]